MQPIRVLVVDDSRFFREFLRRGLLVELPPGSEIATAGEPFEARDRILDFHPDVMILDVEMPKMDGIEFLTKLLAQYDQPTIIVTSEPRYQELALHAGAKGFFVKSFAEGDAQALCVTLARKIERIVRDAHTNHTIGSIEPHHRAREPFAPAPAEMPAGDQGQIGSCRLIALGASTGGTEALATVIGMLRPTLPPIAVVQHIPPDFSRLFAERLNHESAFSCKEAADGDLLQPNHIYVAPGDQQMRVVSLGHLLRLTCRAEPRVNGHRPSVDVLFDSVAKVVGAHAVGAIFTGMGADGAKGLLAMRQAGSSTLGQDEATCVVYGMPRAAWELGAVERQLPLKSIPAALMALGRK